MELEIDSINCDSSIYRNKKKIDKVAPRLFSARENCCGCSACFAICPTSAIQMLADGEGFLYPSIDEERCIRCYRCLSVCSFKVDQNSKGFFEGEILVQDEKTDKKTMYASPISYAVKYKDMNVRMSSRSGGIFTALSDAVLSENGVVYGCVLTEEYLAIHTRAEDKAKRNRMRGSKYIQSDMSNSFVSVKKDLQAGRHVLFSGTSCQVAGLKTFLGNQALDLLLCVDIVCHGVPSPYVWKAYLAWQEKKYGGKIQSVDFRNKRDFGWKAHKESVYLDNVPRIDSEVFKTLFYSHNILRPCCHVCPYKDIHHPGDITIADYWGIEKEVPGFDDNHGVSLVLINNDKGQRWFEKVSGLLEFHKTELMNNLQPPLVAPFPQSKTRNQFWQDFFSKDFELIARRYGGYGVLNEWKSVLINLKNKILRKAKIENSSRNRRKY